MHNKKMMLAVSENDGDNPYKRPHQLFCILNLCCWHTCIRGQVEVKDGDDSDEDTGDDDVQHVVQRLPLND